MKAMDRLEMAYYLQFQNINGMLRHPKYDSFSEWKQNQKS